MIVKYYNKIKNLYKINYINIKIYYINVNILNKMHVIIPYIKPEIKLFNLIIHKIYNLILIQII